eukprot:1232049-Prymnesium_polylepis.1
MGPTSHGSHMVLLTPRRTHAERPRDRPCPASLLGAPGRSRRRVAYVPWILDNIVCTTGQLKL